MKIILMRHGPDVRLGPEGPSLSEAGVVKVRQRASLLKEHIPSIDWCSSSPAKRALDTFHAVADIIPCKRFCVSTALEPGQPVERLAGLIQEPLGQGAKIALIVGHEPQLSQYYLDLACPDVELAQPWIMPQGDAFMFDYPADQTNQLTLTFLGPKRPLQFAVGRTAPF